MRLKGERKGGTDKITVPEVRKWMKENRKSDEFGRESKERKKIRKKYAKRRGEN